MQTELRTELIRELIVESLDGLDAFEQALLLIERGEQTIDALNDAFRIIHTIKGSAGCVGLTAIEELSHAGEGLLGALRDGTVQPSREIANALFRYSDALRSLLSGLEHGDTSPHQDQPALIRDLIALQSAVSAPAQETHEAFGLFEDETEDTVPVAIDIAPPAARQPEPSTSSPAIADSVIRVDVTQIDKLMNLVGELVLARNQIVQCAASLREASLSTAVQRVNLITTELQESVMKTRMQPVDTVWAKFPRIVRDLCFELGKEVTLSMEGREVELDRTVIEAIKDPLTHIIRNAVDHGIETAAERIAKGKPSHGSIRLRAYHEGGQVNIEISDDGAGIDRDQVLRKALQKGIVSPEQAARMSEREVIQIVFMPGFSTASKVTNVSGRGVGMDVVRNNIERVGGTIDIHSVFGEGTTIQLKIPLTLAIIPALIVSSGGARYAIPQASLIELVRVESRHSSKIDYVHSSPVYRLRGQLLPLVDLHEQLQTACCRSESDPVYLVVLQAEGQHFGLMVDTVSDTEEIVVKPLGKLLKDIPAYAGATIMGDGVVALILDVLGIARGAGILDELQRKGVRSETHADRDSGSKGRSVLIVHVGGIRAAIPLEVIDRVEEAKASSIERTADAEALQYRGHIMPLVHVGAVLGLKPRNRSLEPETILQIVVCASEGRMVGLLIDQVEDIVEDSWEPTPHVSRPGVEGAYVIGGRITSILDVDRLAGMAWPVAAARE